MKTLKLVLAAFVIAGFVMAGGGCAFFTAQRVGTFVAKKAAMHVGKKVYKQMKEDDEREEQAEARERHDDHSMYEMHTASHGSSSSSSYSNQSGSSSSSTYHRTYQPSASPRPMRDPVRPKNTQP